MGKQLIMKKLILTSILLASGMCHGEVSAHKTTNSHQKEKDCNSGAEMAESIMSTRQSGESIRTIYKALESIQDDSSEIIKDIVNRAYSQPLYSNDVDKKNAVREFGDQIFKECMMEK